MQIDSLAYTCALEPSVNVELTLLFRSQGFDEDVKDNPRIEWLVFGLITLAAAAFRFWRIDHPAGVVCVNLLSLSHAFVASNTC